MEIRLHNGVVFSQKLSEIEETCYMLKNANGLSIHIHKENLSLNAPKLQNQIVEIAFFYPASYLQAISFDIDLSARPFFVEIDLCCALKLLHFEMQQTKTEGVRKNIFLESKALSLLLFFPTQQLMESSTCDQCKFLTRPMEKDKIVLAKTILMEQMQQPPTIAELSLSVGINQCYLKKGFRELFGTTIYEFIQNQRMQKAQLLLKSTQQSISEIADQVGFSNHSSFSSAFKKYTGLLPSEFQMN